MGDITDYIIALFTTSKWLLTGGPYFVEAVVKRAFPIAWKNFDERFSPEKRRKFELVLMAGGVLLAGFFAWQGEHQQVSTLQHQLKEVDKNRDIINAITNLVGNGNKIAFEFEVKNNTDAIIFQYREWESKCLIVLSNKLDQSYLAQFQSAKGNGLMLLNHSADDRDYCSALEIRRNYGGRDAFMTTGSGHYYTALVERAETKPPTQR